MAIEIERKFLVKDASWRQATGEGLPCRQGYLLYGEGTSVRVRLIGNEAFLAIKGPTTGISRAEFEYPIPVDDAEALLEMCGDAVVEKVRYYITYAGMLWILDLFTGRNEGLVMAEVELESEEQPVELPEWLGKEVSGDPRFYNASLAIHPFQKAKGMA